MLVTIGKSNISDWSNTINKALINQLLTYTIPVLTINEIKKNKMEINLNEFGVMAACPVKNVLARLGDKWSVLVILFLGSEGTMRFNTLHKTVQGISQKMLTVTLRTLETDGIISRQVYAEVPPRVEYQLTELGKGLLPHIKNLSDWALTNMKDVLDHRASFSKHP